MDTELRREYITVETTEVGLNYLRDILEDPGSRAILKGITIIVILRSCPPELYNEFEGDEDRRANDESATVSLNRVFNLLTEHLFESAPFLRLSLDAVYSPTDSRDHSLVVPRPDFGVRDDLYEMRWRFSTIDLIPTEVAKFPSLPFVKEFQCGNYWGLTRRWAAHVATLLTPKMTNATTVTWRYDPVRYEWGAYYMLDRMHRDQLVEAIMPSEGSASPAMDLPPSVTDFNCILKAPDCDIVQRLPDFLQASGVDYDPVGLALRHLTRNCERVTIEGPLHMSLLDIPSTTTIPAALRESSWRNLVELDITLDQRQPDGQWLHRFHPDTTDTDENPIPATLLNTPLECINAQLPPGYYAVDSDEFEEAEDFFDDNLDEILLPEQAEGGYICVARTVPDVERINAWIGAFGRTCAALERLERASLNLEGADRLPNFVAVAAPGIIKKWDDEFVGGSEWWRVYLRFRDVEVNESVMDVLRGIGRARGGGESRVVSLCPNKYW